MSAVESPGGFGDTILFFHLYRERGSDRGLGRDAYKETGMECIPSVRIRHVHGRIKCNRYMDANGNEQVIYEIVARKLEIINQEDRV